MSSETVTPSDKYRVGKVDFHVKYGIPERTREYRQAMENLICSSHLKGRKVMVLFSRRHDEILESAWSKVTCFPTESELHVAEKYAI